MDAEVRNVLRRAAENFYNSEATEPPPVSEATEPEFCPSYPEVAFPVPEVFPTEVVEIQFSLQTRGVDSTAPEVHFDEAQKNLRDLLVGMGDNPTITNRFVGKLEPDEVKQMTKLLTPLSGIKHNVAPANRLEAVTTAVASLATEEMDKIRPGHGFERFFQGMPALLMGIQNAQPYVFDGDRSSFERSRLGDRHDAPKVVELLNDLADYVASGGEVIPEQFNDILVAKYANKSRLGGLIIMTLQKEDLPLDVVRFLQSCVKPFLAWSAQETANVFARQFL